MIESDLVRQSLLGITAAVFVLIAIKAFVYPSKLASSLGYQLSAPNGYSEMYAVYVGVWVATAILAVVSMLRVREALFGDLLAILVLSQPAARLLALFKWGSPKGNLFKMLILEAVGGVALLLVRPSS